MKEYLRVKLSPTDDVEITDYGILLNKIKRKSGIDSISEAILISLILKGKMGKLILRVM